MKHMEWQVLNAVISVMMLLTACATASTPEPTEISPTVATETPKSSATFTPTNTITPTPIDQPPLAAKAGETWVRSVDGMVMAYIPEGSFLMGAAENDYDAEKDEKPQHEVYLDAFWMDTTEVTNEMFRIFVDDSSYETEAEKEGNSQVFTLSSKGWNYIEGADWYHPHGPNSNLEGLDKHPVTLVSYYDAKAYCKWIGGSLPSEAQWEKAARGGLEGMKYPWGNEEPICDKRAKNGAQFYGCFFPGIPTLPTMLTSPVASFSSNGYGLYDMAGNVWEWVLDWYSETYYGTSEINNPTGPFEMRNPVLRGGGWWLPQELRVSYRGAFAYDRDVNNDFIGFRCFKPARK